MCWDCRCQAGQLCGRVTEHLPHIEIRSSRHDPAPGTSAGTSGVRQAGRSGENTRSILVADNTHRRAESPRACAGRETRRSTGKYFRSCRARRRHWPLPEMHPHWLVRASLARGRGEEALHHSNHSPRDRGAPRSPARHIATPNRAVAAFRPTPHTRVHLRWRPRSPAGSPHPRERFRWTSGAENCGRPRGGNARRR